MTPQPPSLPKSMATWKKVCLWIFGIWFVGAVIGALPKTESGSRPTTTAAEDGAALAAEGAARHAAARRANPSICLELPSYKAVAGEYSTVITGSITNTCGRSFRYVQVTFKLFDRSGAVVGTALANQNNLDPGETW